MKKLLIALTSTILFFYWSGVALADTPPDLVSGCASISDTVELFYDFAPDAQGWTRGAEMYWDGANQWMVGTTGDNQYGGGGIDGPVLESQLSTLLSATVTISDVNGLSFGGSISDYSTNSYMEYRIFVFGGSHKYEYQYPVDYPSWDTFSITYNLGATPTLNYLDVAIIGNTSNRVVYWDDITITIPCQNLTGLFLPPQTCDLVPNADFTTTDDWNLSPGINFAQIITTTPGNLFLTGGTAAQNITGLSSNTTYNVTISVTNVLTPPFLLATTLGLDWEEIEISAPGVYSTSLTTENVSGPVLFSLDSPLFDSVLYIDYVCLSLAATGPGGEQYTCLAPPNGEFDTSTGWDYYRGAAWTAAKNVSLPAADYGLIIESDAFSMPSLDAGEYLLMSFDAYGHNDNGMIGSYASAGAAENTGYYQVYETWYTFEADITDLAGGASPYLSFVNVPTGTLTADITLDNVCIFIADRPAQLPYPSDPYSTPPIDLGFSITSCADVDSIWSGFGVNMAQYRSDYAAGASVWDPAGWVPWLVSAIFTTLADWSCLFLAAWYYIINLLNYLWSALTNYATWLWLTGKEFATSLWEWFVWFGTSGLATYSAITTYLGELIAYYFNVLRLIAAWLWESMKTYAGAYFNFVRDIVFWLWQSLIGLAEGILQGLITITAWMLDYLYYYLHGFQNFILYAWNMFVATLSATIGYIVSLAAAIWNSLINTLQIIADWFSLVWVLMVLAWNFLYTIFQFFIALLSWVIDLVLVIIWLPIDIINGIAAGFSAAPFDLITCDTGVWCAVLYGVGVTNAVAGPGVLYPVMIGMIIFCTIQLIRWYIDDLTDFVMTALREL